MKIQVTFAWVGFLFYLAIVGIRKDMNFEVLGISGVMAFLLSLVAGLRFVEITDDYRVYEILSAIASTGVSVTITYALIILIGVVI